MKFLPNCIAACGQSCAVYVGIENCPGVSIKFEPHTSKDEGFEYVTVETSKGPIYLKMRMGLRANSSVSKYNSNYKYDTPGGPDGVEHYITTQLAKGECSADVGVFLLAHEDRAKFYIENNPQEREYYENYFKSAKENNDAFREAIKDILLYQSPMFHNNVHPERTEPFCQLFIYDKGMKNEVQAGV